MTKPRVFGTFPIVTDAAGQVTTHLRISTQIFRGKLGLDVRLYKLNDDKTAFRPQVRGVRIPRRLIREVVEAMILAGREVLSSPED